MAILNVITITNGPVKSDAGVHGYDIGSYLAGVKLEIDDSTLHEGWVKIVGPAGLAPWKQTGKYAWIELAHTTPENVTEKKYLVTISRDGSAKISRIG